MRFYFLLTFYKKVLIYFLSITNILYMSESDKCPVRDLLRTSIWEFIQLPESEEVIWLTKEEATDLIRWVYCPVKIWSNIYEAAQNRWLSNEEAQQYSKISLTWFRKRTSEQKKLLNSLEEKMRIFQKDAAEKLKQQIINSKI